MVDLMTKMKVNGFKYRFPFQKGIIIACKSLQELYTYLHDKHGIEYILTNHRCQDCIENFFSRMRDDSNDHPNSVRIK